MKTQQLPETRGGDPYPPEPHFDEERTLLSARPVVPLGELKKKVRSRRLFLTGAFALAVLLGASASVLIVYLKQRQTEPTPTISSQPGDSFQTENQGNQGKPSPNAVNETPATVPNDQQLISHKIQGPQKIVLSAQKPDTSNKRSAAAGEPDLEFPRQIKVADTDGVIIAGQQEISDREARRAARWEERRLRQEALHNRGLNNGNSDDLFRIREIFEGARKPH